MQTLGKRRWKQAGPGRQTSVAAMVLLAALLGGCGGGGGGSPAASSGSTYTITPYKGAFDRGAIIVKNVRGETIATGSFIGSGYIQLSIPDTAEYPITVYATGNYRNEATGTMEVTTTPIRSVIPDKASAANGIAVTPLTEIATAVIEKKVADGESLTPSLVKSTITTVAAAVLNIPYEEAVRPPVSNVVTGTTKDRVTMALSAIALSAHTDGVGATLADRVKDVAAKIANGISPSAALASIQSALTAVSSTSGVSSVQDSSNPILGPVAIPATYALTDPGFVQPDTLKWDTNALVWNTAKWR